MNATQQLHNMSQDLLNQRPFEENFFQTPEKSNFLEQILGGISGGVGMAGGSAGIMALLKKLGLMG